MKYLDRARKTAKGIVRSYFKNDDGEPFELTDRQADIFIAIFCKRNPRVQVIACTQYGKSDVTAMAILLRSSMFREHFTIVAGRKEKGMIIMSKVIQHIFDRPELAKKLELDNEYALDRLRRERSRDHLTWLGGGGIRVLTANARNTKAIKDSLTGFGSPNVIQDESALISDKLQAMIMRMLGGHKENFLFKIGNPFNRNHFHRTWNSGRYKQIFINYKTALKEGRYTEDFIEEMRDEPFFDILYECLFPDEGEILPSGYRKLIKDELLKNAYISEEKAKELMKGRKKLGADFAGGGKDRSAYVIRWPKVMKLISTNRIADTMQQIPIIEKIMEENKIDASEVSLDYGGLGQGIGDRLLEKEYFVNCIRFGQSAPEEEKDKYKNMRAYMYYEFFKWIKNGGKIIKDDGFSELLMINYKEDSERKLQIESKKDLKRRMEKAELSYTSPDIADAGALTFADNIEPVDEDDVELI